MDIVFIVDVKYIFNMRVDYLDVLICIIVAMQYM